MTETRNRCEGQPAVIGTRWPLVYLMPDGPALLSLEWEIGGWDITLSTTDGKTGEAHGLHRETGEDWGREINLHDPEAWRWLEARLREAEGGKTMAYLASATAGRQASLQLRRIDSAIERSKAIEARLLTMGEQIELVLNDLVLNDILDHQRTLHAIRLGMIREADEAAAPPPEPAAGPWEPYSEEAYERLRNEDGVVFAEMEKDNFETMVRFRDFRNRVPDTWLFSAGSKIYWRPPLRIARINPPKEATDAHLD